MPTDVPLQCSCGKVHGTALSVAAASGTRIICYCDDCQAFARFLGRADVMDERGGTDIFQLPPASIRLTSGTDALACVRLTGKGMHRWYCAECKTPLGNTLGPKVPFVGVIHSFMAFEKPGGLDRDEVLGRPLARILTKFASGSGPLASSRLGMPRVIARSARLLARAWLTGAGKPSPFFDGVNPRVVPRILTSEERRALDAR